MSGMKNFTDLIIALRLIELHRQRAFGPLLQQGTAIRKMIVAFIQSMTRHGSGAKHC